MGWDDDDDDDDDGGRVDGGVTSGKGALVSPKVDVSRVVWCEIIAVVSWLHLSRNSSSFVERGDCFLVWVVFWRVLIFTFLLFREVIELVGVGWGKTDITLMCGVL